MPHAYEAAESICGSYRCAGADLLQDQGWGFQNSKCALQRCVPAWLAVFESTCCECEPLPIVRPMVAYVLRPLPPVPSMGLRDLAGRPGRTQRLSYVPPMPYTRVQHRPA